MDISGRVAIVTGAASGLGAVTAERLAERGVNIVISDVKNSAECEAAAAACAAKGVETLIVQANIAEDADCRRVAREALDRFGRIDILVNNAATTRIAAQGDLEALNAADFQAIYSVNLIGPYQMIRACAPAMKAQGLGAVVNVSSVAAVTGASSSIAYAASKGALNTLTMSLARALAPEIRVNAVCPGFMATPWVTDRIGEKGLDTLSQHFAEVTPLREVGTADLVADSVVFLCAEGARHITGETLLADAGIHLTIAEFAPKR